MTDKREVELKPCPKCLSNNVKLGVFKKYGSATIACNNCGIMMNRTHVDSGDSFHEKLISDWNTRKGDPGGKG